jgi:two-component system response regulator AtoC
MTPPMAQGPELLLVGESPALHRIATLAPDLGLVSTRVKVDEIGALAALRPVVMVVAAVDSARTRSDLPGPLLDFAESVRDVPVVLLASGPKDDSAALAGSIADVLEPDSSDEELRRALRRALAIAHAEVESGAERHLIGESKPMQRLLDLIRRAAPGSSTVLVRGESGTGKELVARTLHELSARRAGPFVKVHCAALPDTLLESELFGYERGAFTGAVARRIGRVEQCRGGTLFLDEIGDITLSMQVKLLRLLQDREFERLGSNESIRADVRFIAATHRDLDAMVRAGEFRGDLFYRLNVVTLWVPPLRARREDIAPLARRFCRESAELNARPDVELSDAALRGLRELRWPGNVRQLQNFVERLVVLSENRRIEAEDVVKQQADEVAVFSTQPGSRVAPSSVHGASSSGAAPPMPLDEALRRAERRALERALEHARGNRTLAARILGIGRATLYKKLAEHDLA